MLKVGDKIRMPWYGEGVVRKVDTRKFYPDKEFFYFVDFTGRHGDGTKVWLPKLRTEKIARKRA